MDDLSMEAFEARAAAAEQMLAELTLKQASAVSAADITYLKNLRETLVKVKEEQEALNLRMKEVLAERAKLKYQAEHLKRAVREADEKNQNGKRPHPL
ncbi:hypothetical protein WJX75_002240 [Coccomyxa subellipsoidea]|uniref:Uncharacterized protein n=1 Tax=Coccomyxa subellipsoidea TaxID=248742 RepID=A0ABR2Z1X9_9CHLO